MPDKFDQGTGNESISPEHSDHAKEEVESNISERTIPRGEFLSEEEMEELKEKARAITTRSSDSSTDSDDSE